MRFISSAFIVIELILYVHFHVELLQVFLFYLFGVAAVCDCVYPKCFFWVMIVCYVALLREGSAPFVHLLVSVLVKQRVHFQQVVS